MTKAKEIYKVRLCFRWEGPLMWVAHLDRMRALQRILLRAKLPLLYSQGYNPRPQFVFALPTPVGIRSESEYVDIHFEEVVSLEEIARTIQSQCVEGLELLSLEEIEETKTETIMGLVRLADYVFSYPNISPVMENLMNQENIIVQKFSKKRYKDVDIKPLVYEAKAQGNDCYFLRVYAGSKKNLRADLFLQALEKYSTFEDYLDIDIVRKELWIKKKKEDRYLVQPITRGQDIQEIKWYEE